MSYRQNILELIGKTPLVKLNRLTRAPGIEATVLAKMESLNPGYSVKDRIGISLVEAAEKSGKLRPGGTLIEATSGNTGIGLALVAAVKEYECIFVVTDKVSQEKIDYLKAFGAEVVTCSREAKPGTKEHYVEVAKELAKQTPNSFYPDQYTNPANPEAHYQTTGPEIWEGTEHKITHFIAGVGTGGTISGAGRYLKEQNPDIRIIGADPYGSVFKTYKETGQLSEGAPYLVEGIGKNDIIRKADLPQNIDWDVIDEIINVTDHESFQMAQRLGREEGIFCGGSTGTNAAAALEVAKGAGKNGLVVFIVCDTGEHYLSKHHSQKWLDQWMQQQPLRKS